MSTEHKSQSHDKGVAGEDFVNQLAYKSFMKYWCYPNPTDINGDKKEICDLIIHFKDILLLICVKNYDFKGNYDRYIKKTIEKDIKQLCGAERKIRQAKDGIQIKHPDHNENVCLDASNIRETHLISVHFGGDEVEVYPPFDKVKDNFIHIFNNLDFKQLMTELDTLPDFIEYLNKRNVFFCSSIDNKIYISGTEMDLTARYLMNNRSFSSLIIDKANPSHFDISGCWTRFKSREEVKKRDIENKKSYFIDNLVRDQIDIGGDNLHVAKFLLSFDRFDRRCIADSFFDFYNKFKNQRLDEVFVGRRYWKVGNIAFVFSFIDPPQCNIDNMVRLIGESYIISNNYDMDSLFVISTVKNMNQFKFALFTDIIKMTESEEAQIMEGAKYFGWFNNEEQVHNKVKEYPDC